MKHARFWPTVATALALGSLLLACEEQATSVARAPVATMNPDALPRPFLLGVSSVPVEASETAYAEAFRLAGELGEIILIQRAPPWTDFMPGGSISPRTERLTRLERDLARQYSLRLLIAIDPTMPSDRGRLANLPDSHAGRDFADKDLRASFIAYAKYMALNYKPAYLALGVEMDLFYARRGSASFRNFVSLYFEAYDAVKDVSPQTLVFPTFQYENVLGILTRGQPTQPAWSLVESFQPKLDLLGISSFPRFAFQNLHDVPSDYYDALAQKFDKPVAFVSVGWGSENAGLEGDASQVAYLYRVFAAADRLDSAFVVWFLGQDLEAPADSSLGPLASMGLYDRHGVPKSVLRVWRGHLSRPLR